LARILKVNFVLINGPERRQCIFSGVDGIMSKSAFNGELNIQQFWIRRVTK